MLALLSAFVLNPLLFAAAQAVPPLPPSGDELPGVCIDLGDVVNTSFFDDNVVGNRKGGWTDEGSNDLRGWPPLPLGGTFDLRGYKFRIIDPGKNNGKSCIGLKGDKVATHYPSDIAVAFKPVKAEFIFAMTALGNTDNHPKSKKRTGVFTIIYEDGAIHDFPVAADKELKGWWMGPWWDNMEVKKHDLPEIKAQRGRSEEERSLLPLDDYAVRWPVFPQMSALSSTYRIAVGFQASRFVNPHPDRPIKGMKFHSDGYCNIFVAALTLSNQDYSLKRAWKENQVKAVPAAPEGFYYNRVWEEAVGRQKDVAKDPLCKGVTGAFVVSPEILALEIDPGIDFDAVKKDNITINGKHPVDIGHRAFTIANRKIIGKAGLYPVMGHHIYLFLDEKLQDGKNYEIKTQNIVLGDGKKRSWTYRFEDTESVNPAIKVNQAGYAPAAARRYAYYGHWLGNRGALDLKEWDPEFEVLDDNGKIVLEGTGVHRPASIRKKGKKKPEKLDIDPDSGQYVVEFDISSLQPGTDYRIHLPGAGVSWPFHISDKRSAYNFYVVCRGLYHQRCGSALEEPYTKYTRPECHVANHVQHLQADAQFFPPNQPKKETVDIRGGWHDAGDFDRRIFHVDISERLYTIYEMFPDRFADGQLDLPESGNGIPDLIDEGNWGIRVFLELQDADGGARPGNESFGHPDIQHGLANTDIMPYWIYGKSSGATARFAGVAAQAARLNRPFNRKLADQYLDAAKRAYDWAKTVILDLNNVHVVDKTNGESCLDRKIVQAVELRDLLAPQRAKERGQNQERIDELKKLGADKTDIPPNLAIVKTHRWTIGNKESLSYPALQLAATTGNRRYVDDFHEFSGKNPGRLSRAALWPYLSLQTDNVDRKLRKSIRKSIISAAERDLQAVNESAYPYAKVKAGSFGGWGNFDYTMLRAYALTGDRKFLDGCSLIADQMLGCNGLGRTYITGLGSKSPMRPMHSDSVNDKYAEPVPGIPVYAMTNQKDIDRGVLSYPRKSETPPHLNYADVEHIPALSEFTVWQNQTPITMLFGLLLSDKATKPEKAWTRGFFKE